MPTSLANNHPLGRLGLDWQLTEYHGWGVFGLNLALSLIKNGYQAPQLFRQHNLETSKFPELESIFKEYGLNHNHLAMILQ